LPTELSEQMDAAKVALATRIEYLRLERGRTEAAGELWEAVKDRQRPELLSAAVRECLDHPDLAPVEAVERAAELREAADRARAQAQRLEAEPSDDVDAEALADAMAGIRRLLGLLRAGGRLSRYDAGSLRLFATELLALVEPDAGVEAAVA
jgi:ParB family chromosome partitioning protein